MEFSIRYIGRPCFRIRYVISSYLNCILYLLGSTIGSVNLWKDIQGKVTILIFYKFDWILPNILYFVFK